MHVLFIGNNFPPEVAPLARRMYEHAKQWCADGGSVEVLTDVPNYPEGVVYDGYNNRFTREEMDGILVNRVPMYIAPNQGTVRRITSYISFMLSVIWYSQKVRTAPDVVAASSPQFFSAIAGYVVSLLKGVPFVFEVRDLWPDSIVAVGAMDRNWIIRLFERIELFLYRQAHHIVVVTDTFKQEIRRKGIAEGKISVMKNGANLDFYSRSLDQSQLREIEARHDLNGKFVASYIGTIGMAHRAEVLLEAAHRSKRDDIVYLVMGTGAEREKLERKFEELKPSTFRLIDKQPKEMVPYYLALSDVSVVHLRDDPLFKTVIPSKIFEAMAMKKPIVLGVRGETREIIEEANAGIAVEPENPDEIISAVERLAADDVLYRQMANDAYIYVHDNFDRQKIARAYWSLLERVVAKSRKGQQLRQAAA